MAKMITLIILSKTMNLTKTNWEYFKGLYIILVETVEEQYWNC